MTFGVVVVQGGCRCDGIDLADAMAEGVVVEFGQANILDRMNRIYRIWGLFI